MTMSALLVWIMARSTKRERNGLQPLTSVKCVPAPVDWFPVGTNRSVRLHALTACYEEENVVRIVQIVCMMAEFTVMDRPLLSREIGVTSVPVTVATFDVKEQEYVLHCHVE